MAKVWHLILKKEQAFLREKYDEMQLLKQAASQNQDLTPVYAMHEEAYRAAYESFAAFQAELLDLDRYFHRMQTERPIEQSLSQVPETHRRSAAGVLGAIRCLKGRPSDVHRQVLRKKQGELLNSLGTNILNQDPNGLENDVQSYLGYIFAEDCLIADNTAMVNRNQNLLFAGGGAIAGMMAGLYKEDLMSAINRVVTGVEA